MKKAIAIRHVPFEDLGNLAGVLHHQGYAVSYIEAAAGFLDEIHPLSPDLVVVLGGPIGAYDDEDYPFFPQEIDFLQQRLAADLPTLGICLGAQLMARALGAKVYPGDQKEIGWFPIELSDRARHSPLSYLASEHTPVLHWHGDTFDLPAGAVHLASSSKYQNQAFAWGNCGLALQFHPEVTLEGLERWFIGHACEIGATPDLSVGNLRADTARYAETLGLQAAKLWQGWLSHLETSPHQMVKVQLRMELERALTEIERQKFQQILNVGTVCPSCSKVNLPHSKFCIYCGNQITCTCCGSSVLPNSRFCTNCGQPVRVAASV